MICNLGGSKSRLAKAAGAEVAVSLRYENLRAAVVRNAFPYQNAQNTSDSDHFLKVRCRKIARHCGEKRICKAKCAKCTMFGPLFEFGVRKNGTPLWREALFQVKMYKTRNVWTIF